MENTVAIVVGLPSIDTKKIHVLWVCPGGSLRPTEWFKELLLGGCWVLRLRETTSCWNLHIFIEHYKTFIYFHSSLHTCFLHILCRYIFTRNKFFLESSCFPPPESYIIQHANMLLQPPSNLTWNLKNHAFPLISRCRRQDGTARLGLG